MNCKHVCMYGYMYAYTQTYTKMCACVWMCVSVSGYTQMGLLSLLQQLLWEYVSLQTACSPPAHLGTSSQPPTHLRQPSIHLKTASCSPIHLEWYQRTFLGRCPFVPNLSGTIFSLAHLGLLTCTSLWDSLFSIRNCLLLTGTSSQPYYSYLLTASLSPTYLVTLGLNLGSRVEQNTSFSRI